MFNLSITTAERIVFESDKVKFATLPTSTGELTILPSHSPLMSVLGTGETIIATEEGESSVFVDGGLLLVSDDKVEVLTDTAEKATDLDEAKIEEAKRKAEKLLEEKPIDVDLAIVEAALKRELMKQKLVSKYKPS